MDRWALKYAEHCTFVVACCAGKELAEQFASELRLRHCLNVWVDDDDMPKWGQLGCQGFIVGDSRHSIVCKSTSAFMQVRELAFKHCETLVDSLLGSCGAPSLSSLTRLHPGAMVRLHSLSKAELNGAQAIVTEAVSVASNGRCVVQTALGQILSIKPDNLALATPVGGDDCCGGGCGGGGCGEDEGDCGSAGEVAEGCVKGGCDKSGCAKKQKGQGQPQNVPNAEVEAAAAKLAQASRALLDSVSGDMPARMRNSLQKKEAAAREELKAAQAVQLWLQAAPASAEPIVPGGPPLKKEAFKGAISLGVCANDLCMCADCECGLGCTCNVSEAETCEPCTEFRAAKKQAQGNGTGGGDASAPATVSALKADAAEMLH